MTEAAFLLFPDALMEKKPIYYLKQNEGLNNNRISIHNKQQTKIPNVNLVYIRVEIYREHEL